MGTMSSAKPLTKQIVARVPYLNCAPFFAGLSSSESVEFQDLPPRILGIEAESGQITAGPMSLADYLKLQDRFERLGHLGVAVRGRSGSALLFSRVPIRQLSGAAVAVTNETATTSILSRLILEQRYELTPRVYQMAPSAGLTSPQEDAEAIVLIGDAAMKFHATNRRFPYEIDLSFEWWLWQHLPFVFAVWVVRKDAGAEDKQRVSRLIQHQLAVNIVRLDQIAKERAPSVGWSPEETQRYLEHFIFRLSKPEEEAIVKFQEMSHALPDRPDC